jgi:hypothetical protein
MLCCGVSAGINNMGIITTPSDYYRNTPAAKPSVARPIAEKELLANVRKLASLCGWLVYHTHDSRRSEGGFPDLVMVRMSQCLFVELKSERGKLSDEQQQWIDWLSDSNPQGRVLVWRPSDWLSGEIEQRLR